MPVTLNTEHYAYFIRQLIKLLEIRHAKQQMKQRRVTGNESTLWTP